jgi:anti-anti-sigma factor
MADTSANQLSADITSVDKDELILTLHGELDLATVAELQTTIALAVATHPAATLVLDTADVSLVDSTGLRLLRDLASDPSLGFVVANPPRSLTRLLELTLLSATIATR